jgi:glycosyltransferase involved in cell wall biosynthesis
MPRSVQVVGFDFTTIGGVATVVKTLSNAWVNRGDDVRVAELRGRTWVSHSTIDSLPEARTQADRRLRVYELVVDSSPVDALRRSLSRMPGSIVRLLYGGATRRRKTSWKRLCASSDNWAPDVVIFTHPVLVDLLSDVPSSAIRVVQYHDSWERALSSGHAAFIKAASRAVDAVVFLTAEDASLASSAGVSNARVLPNPVLPISSSYRGRDRRFISAGRLSRQKQIGHLLRAWELSGLHKSEWRLAIFGEGPERRRLQRAISRSRLVDSVTLEGITTRLGDEMARSHAFVLTSRHEGYPMVLLEAASVGIPIVAYDCSPGVREIVRPAGAGYRVAPGDVLGLARRLQQIASADSAQLGMMKEAGRAVAHRHSIESVLRAWDELLIDLTETRALRG